MIAEDWWTGLTHREQFIFTQMLTALSAMRGDQFAEDLVKLGRKNMDAIYPPKRPRKTAPSAGLMGVDRG